MAKKEPTVTLWVCGCCYWALNYAEPCQCPDDHPQELMSKLADSEATPGMLQEGHSCGRQDGSYCGECDCEEIPFSHSPCAGCGSSLYGERHAVTGWV